MRRLDCLELGLDEFFACGKNARDKDGMHKAIFIS